MRAHIFACVIFFYFIYNFLLFQNETQGGGLKLLSPEFHPEKVLVMKIRVPWSEIKSSKLFKLMYLRDHRVAAELGTNFRETRSKRCWVAARSSAAELVDASALTL